MSNKADQSMRYLIRSMRYLRPHRGRILLSFACAAVIAVLWGGGLAAVLPGAKILLAPEGLHGWAYRAMASDRLHANLEYRQAPAYVSPAEREMLFVAKAHKESALSGQVWITGVNAPRDRDAETLARDLALSPTGVKAAVETYDAASGTAGRTEAVMGRLGTKARLLGVLASWLPRPADYAGRFQLLLWLLVFVMVVTIVRGVLQMVQGYLTGSAVMSAAAALRLETYGASLHLPVTYFSAKGFTDSMSRLLYDTEQVALGQSVIVSTLVLQPAKALGAMAVAMLLSWRLTLLSMVAGPAVLLVIRHLGRLIRRLGRRAFRTVSELTGILGETLSGIRVVKAYTMEGAERRRFLRANRKLVRQRLRIMVLDGATGVAVEAMSMVAGMAAIGAAAWMIFNSDGGLEAEEVLALMACLAAMFNSVRKLAKIVPRLQVADAAAKRVFELQDLPRERRSAAASSLPRHADSVAFEHVSYRYPDTSRDVLHDVSLSIEAGKTLAIVGSNGAGKTTLVSMLPRLIDPSEGRVLIDGRDIAAHSIRSVRRQIAIVPQETVLFRASVWENIAYGLSRPSRRDVQAAAERAFVDEFAKELPEGFETVIGPGGATLSGGQRQRIAIARAILRGPAILIFDEALSEVDSESEHKIRQALGELVGSCTTFLIAHSFATVQWADRIAVMQAGRLLGVGGHDDLLAGCEAYRRLYNTQLAAYREPIN
jgi:ABC-type multidrug transport system fused ATPase/permease subunit